MVVVMMTVEDTVAVEEAAAMVIVTETCDKMRNCPRHKSVQVQSTQRGDKIASVGCADSLTFGVWCG